VSSRAGSGVPWPSLVLSRRPASIASAWSIWSQMTPKSAPGEIWRLLLCYQPQGHPPGGDMVDDPALAISRRDAVRYQTLVHRRPLQPGIPRSEANRYRISACIVLQRGRGGPQAVTGRCQVDPSAKSREPSCTRKRMCRLHAGSTGETRFRI
jgi:hypothetical protein